MWINLQRRAKLFFRVAQFFFVFQCTSESEMGAYRVRFLPHCGLQLMDGPRLISLSKKRQGQVVVSFPILVSQLESRFECGDATRDSVRLGVQNSQCVVGASRGVIVNALEQGRDLLGSMTLLQARLG